MTPSERVKRILDEAVGRDLSSFERFNFLPSIAKFETLSEKQESGLEVVFEALGTADAPSTFPMYIEIAKS